MLLLDDLAFVHFPKAAGSTIRVILRDHFGGDNRRDLTHVPAALLRDLIGGRLVAGSVRHPFTWYDSRVGYAKSRGKPLPFDGFDVTAHTPDEFVALTDDDAFLAAHEDVTWTRGGVAFRPFRAMRRLGVGFFTFEFLLTFAGDLRFAGADAWDAAFLDGLLPQRWIRAEAPERGVIELMTALGKLDPATEEGRRTAEAVMSARRVNARDASLPAALSEASRAIVARRDAAVLARFYPDGAAP